MSIWRSTPMTLRGHYPALIRSSLIPSLLRNQNCYLAAVSHIFLMELFEFFVLCCSLSFSMSFPTCWLPFPGFSAFSASGSTTSAQTLNWHLSRPDIWTAMNGDRNCFASQAWIMGTKCSIFLIQVHIVHHCTNVFSSAYYIFKPSLEAWSPTFEGCILYISNLTAVELKVLSMDWRQCIPKQCSFRRALLWNW